jgi:hypothetical protein
VTCGKSVVSSGILVSFTNKTDSHVLNPIHLVVNKICLKQNLGPFADMEGT